MAASPDVTTLRRLLQGVVQAIGDRSTHACLPEVCRRLGLPEPPVDAGAKWRRAVASLAALPDSEVPVVAQNILDQEDVDAPTRNAIEDELWAPHQGLSIPTRTRRDIAQELDLEPLVHYPDRFTAMLDRLWVLDGGLADVLAPTRSLRALIDRHVLANPGDWSAEDLFERLGAFDAGDARFERFLLALMSPYVLPDEPAQRRVVAIVSPHLNAIGAELLENGQEGGYPLFVIALSGASRNRTPKNLIFATLSKPDIRFRNAVDNAVELLGDPDACLMYDQPIGPGGVLWRDLQAWWKDSRDITDDGEAKRSLYQRLGRCLPANSPAQRNLWELYHEIHGPAVHELPALLPEIWLHWDPKTVEQRGRDALLHLRMDFLLLMPHNCRVVLEVDGSQHYATAGRPDRHKYAAQMRGDRNLKLAGYEVFRFGTAELEDRTAAKPLLEEFFTTVFQRFNVPVA
ncbi:hypothetical protein ACFWY5_11870 [Nonomuraea sp. NPDC059007]|uniref:AbiJ-related protein n=1 Tax=Nonomuraea sp. NPDC059007 TaxID=3346692 RepID=UPI003689EE5C